MNKTSFIKKIGIAGLIKIALVGLMMIYFIYYFAGYQYNVLCY